MRKLEGFVAAGCLLFMALGCGICALFSGGDIGPVSESEGGFYLTIKLLVAFVAVGLALTAIVTGLLALRAKDAPPRRLTRAQLLAYRGQPRRK
jgi:hypothetical protein